MADYIPRNDSDFNLWQGYLLKEVNTNKEPWGIVPTVLAALGVKQTRWEAAYANTANKQNRTSADVQEKSDARADYEPALRGFVAEFLTNNSKVTDSDRERMGLTVKSGSRTPSPVPSSRPVASIDFSIRLQHTINFYDEATPRSKAKPTGTHGCEIWAKKGGEAPKSASELQFLTTDTATPYVQTFDGADAGQIIYYWLRWVNTRGEYGPWSTPVSAMIVS